MSDASVNLHGKAEGLSIADLAKRHGRTEDQIKDAVSAGVQVESEHTDNPGVARQIAMDHVYEDPDYYTKLKKMENESVSRSQSLRDRLRNALAHLG